LSPKAAEKGLALAAFVEPAARGFYRGDPLRVRQVTLNLLSNALKFTRHGAAVVEVSAQPGQGGRTRLRIEVRDTGVGVDPASKTKLFQKFQQADGSITRQFGGTGLGLSISRELVELMGGKIGVADHPGGGAAFWFEIELSPVSGSQGRIGAQALDGLRVLLVDGCDIHRELHARRLATEGAIVSEATSGREGLVAADAAEAAGHPFDVVLVDHLAPETRDADLGERFRRLGGGSPPKLVVIGALGEPLPMTSPAADCIDMLLTHPVRRDDLIDSLTRLAAPRRSMEATSEAADRPPSPAIDRTTADIGRILLAEDNEINTLLAATLLREVGFDVHPVPNGADAVTAAASQTYDLILMDVQMPVMDGPEAARMIRSREAVQRRARTPIIALTADTMSHQIKVHLESGMDLHVAKPIEATDLYRKILKATQMAAMEEPEAERAAS
jgi:CheY-like chemotaxis protein